MTGPISGQQQPFDLAWTFYDFAETFIRTGAATWPPNLTSFTAQCPNAPAVFLENQGASNQIKLHHSSRARFMQQARGGTKVSAVPDLASFPASTLLAGCDPKAHPECTEENLPNLLKDAIDPRYN